MVTYSVKKLATLAGVSVRTLHLYDQVGLLKPSTRTTAGYRSYGEKELLKLQQILFYKELDFPLREIADILDSPDFDLVQALESHRSALQSRMSRISTMLTTIDKTITHLKNKSMLKHEELYAGLLKEKAEAWRKEAIEKWGPDAIERSEDHLHKIGISGREKLNSESKTVTEALAALVQEDPAAEKVQALIARHYACIRAYWGTANSADTQAAAAYRGLGQLYVSDPRFTLIDDKPAPEFALFLSKAMTHFAETKLK
jgi:DNA-binding transcriptional MerR regulator